MSRPPPIEQSTLLAIQGPVVEDEHAKHLRVVASLLDIEFNGDAKGPGRTVGFTLLVYPFNENENMESVTNYISNSKRTDVINLMRKLADRLEANALAAIPPQGSG